MSPFPSANNRRSPHTHPRVTTTRNSRHTHTHSRSHSLFFLKTNPTAAPLEQTKTKPFKRIPTDLRQPRLPSPHPSASKPPPHEPMTATAPAPTTPTPTHPLAIVPVDPATSALRAQPFVERLDRRRLDRLVRHVEAHREDAAANPTYTPTSPKFGHADGLAHLRALARKAKRDGALHVTHKPPGRGRKHDLARVYAVGGLSLACLKRGYRGYLANPAYVDVDLKNAQPTLLRHACAAAGLVTPCLDEYADRCDEVRARIAAATGCTPAQAKNLPIRLLNQGTVAPAGAATTACPRTSPSRRGPPPSPWAY